MRYTKKTRASTCINIEARGNDGGGAEDRTPVQSNPLAGVSRLSYRLDLECIMLDNWHAAFQLVQP